MRIPRLLCLLALAAPIASAKVRNYNLDYEHIPGQLVIGLEEDVPAEIKGLIKQRLSMPTTSLMASGGSYLIEAVGLQGKDSLKELASYIESLPGVRYVEANNIYHLQETIPNDPEFSKLYGLKNTQQQPSGVSADIGATKAWDITTGSKDVVVAIIDTGIDYNHPDLKDNVWTNSGEAGLDENGQDKSTNGIDDDGNGFVDDYRGWNAFDNTNDPMDGNSHGTHVAGTIGGVGNNEIGVAGVNWNVSMIPVKIFSDAGVTNTAAIIMGIDYATTAGAQVSNNSWGGGPASDGIYEAISRANDAGSLFVAAAGNASTDNDQTPQYPASYDLENIIGVASSDQEDKISSFSNYGRTSVHVAAPGSDIYSTIPGGGYGYKSGTSMATPHVVGLVALVKSAFPELGHLQLKDRVLNTSRVIDTISAKVIHGRIDAYSALEIDEKAPNVPGDVTVEFVGLRSVSLSWIASGDDDMQGNASRYEVRYSDQMIDESNWQDAKIYPYSSLASEDEAIFKASITSFDFNTSGYLAVRAFDNVGNKSDISSSVAFSLKPAVSVFENEGELSTDFASIDPNWASVKDEAGNVYFSDSPEASYENSQNSSVVTREFSVDSADLVLEIRSRFDLEKNYDYGYVELKADDGDWQVVEVFNGVQEEWTTKFVSLYSALENASSFRLRFRVETDSSVTRDGWDIDNFRILSAVSE